MDYKKIFILTILLVPLIAYAHDTKIEKDNAHSTKSLSSEKHETAPEKGSGYYSSQNPQNFSDWFSVKLPTLHPMVIHFPIIMLLLAFPLFFITLFFKKEEFRKLSIVICGIGFLGGFAAANIFHPHTEGLPAAAMRALEYHDLFADMTQALSAAATVAGFLTTLEKFKKKAVELIALALMFLAVISVSLTGHFGGTLAYIYGVGTQGKYLEQEHH